MQILSDCVLEDKEVDAAKEEQEIEETEGKMEGVEADEMNEMDI